MKYTMLMTRGVMAVLLATGCLSFNIQLRTSSLKSKLILGEISDDAFSAFAETLEEDELFDEDFKEGTWQESLDEFLDPVTPLARRQVLVSDLIGANAQIRESLQSALKERNIDPILTPTAKKFQEGTKAVARQVTTDILPQIAEVASKPTQGKPLSAKDLPSLLPKITSRIFEATSTQARKSVEQFTQDLADPARIPERLSKQSRDIAQEARNIFRDTPEGLEEPPYNIISKGEGYEIRDYDAVTSASTSMLSEIGEEYKLDDIASSGAAFNALAAYIFGANEEEKTLSMTTPVAITNDGEMWFYLYKNSTSSYFPKPLDVDDLLDKPGKVKLKEISSSRLAVARFTGFVTDGEVARQKDALLAALAIDGVEIDVDHGSVIPHIIFQYNPPYTLPVLRRNEIAVPLRKRLETNLEEEWEGSPEMDDVSPSDG